ncbi:glycosyltransferase family 2 protein [bacterium]|nr:glycosyltransferase family 2 protein [bacterium]MCI0601968.1 glycosyltransferase family 2 protein [bacterium]
MILNDADPAFPLISVVISTYNRSNVLKWAIESVSHQSYKNWELWIIGDACTDDTETMVSSFSDQRIHFHNLPQNVGEQSGPNNEGCKRSTGEYIAFLNHDDLWFPDHLEKSWETMRSTGSDLVFSLVDRIDARGKRQLNGIFRNKTYHPGLLVPASSWLFKRVLFEEIGPWRYYKEIYNIPSQDWLFRVWKSGKKIEMAPYLTVIAITGKQPGSYSERKEKDHKTVFEQLRNDPNLRENELLKLLFSQHDALIHSIDYLSGASFSKLLKALLYKIERVAQRLLKIDPSSYRRRMKLQRKGEFIDRLRRIKGLPKKA